MNTLLQAVTVTAMPERATDNDIGEQFISHSTATNMLNINEASLLTATLTAATDYVTGCNMKQVKPSERAEWLRDKLKAWHNKVVMSANNFDTLVFPEKGANQILGTFVTTGKPTGKNPNGTIALGFTLRSFVSKLCAVFASTNGKRKIKACKNTSNVATKYSELKKPTNSDALRKVQAEAFEGLKFKADTTIKAAHLIALKKVYEAIAKDHMEAVAVEKAA
jgi:hypothetical protein